MIGGLVNAPRMSVPGRCDGIGSMHRLIMVAKGLRPLCGARFKTIHVADMGERILCQTCKDLPARWAGACASEFAYDKAMEHMNENRLEFVFMLDGSMSRGARFAILEGAVEFLHQLGVDLDEEDDGTTEAWSQLEIACGGETFRWTARDLRTGKETEICAVAVEPDHDDWIVHAVDLDVRIASENRRARYEAEEEE